MQGWLVLMVGLAYIGLLFGVAWWGDRRAERAGAGGRSPVLYALTIGVYCTSWTFFGSVGRAAGAGFDFLSIYVGPILVLMLGWPLLVKMVRIAKGQNIVSIADFIAARYGKSQAVAALVTVIAVVGIVPYIALQLKAVTTSYQVLTELPAGSADAPFWRDTSYWVSVAMAVFAILFGVRHIHASEHHRGLMLAIAFESIVKLLAFLAVGVFVTYGLFDGFGDLWRRAAAEPTVSGVLAFDATRPNFWATAFVAAFAILCLPRQFHVAVVENRDPADIKTAAWMFPLYLVVINLFVMPLALAGLLIFGNQQVDADTFVVTLPLAHGRADLALVAFVGGLSAGTSMVIVAAVALSTMVCNDVVMPLLLRIGWLRLAERGDLSGLVLGIRRGAIGVVLLLAYAYHRTIAEAYPLAAIGMLSFVAAAQFAPAMLIGLFWRGGSRAGALAGLAAGFAVWVYTLLLPSFVPAGVVDPAFLAAGPFGLAELRPQALLGWAGFDPVTHAVLWSLSLNVAAYVAVSLLSRQSQVERVQANAFVSAAGPAGSNSQPVRSLTTIADLAGLASRFVGYERTQAAFRAYAARRKVSLGNLEAVFATHADLDALRFTERLLAGAIGAASARVVMATSLEGGALSRDAAMAMLDEASEAIKFNRELLQATLENVSQGICVFDANFRVATWNRRFLELNALPDELVRVGTPLAELVRFNAARGEYVVGGEIETLLSRSRDGQPRVDVYERRRPDGTVLEVQTNPMPDGGFVATFTDVTERNRAAAALREANEGLERRVEERTRELQRAKGEAERANLSKTRFLAAASHDLLQPLNAARLFTSALAEKKHHALVDKVDASLRSVEHLLGALLDVSKLDAGAVKPERGVFPLDELLSTLEVEFAALAREQGLTLRVVHAKAMVDSDPRMLRRILQNFLANAIRYTDSGRVLLGCRRSGRHLRIEVWDTGAGIPEDKQSAIFQEFHRLPGNDRGREKGLGLGLAIVDRIARMLHHRIAVRSTVGRGSCFSVEVPVAVGAARPAAERKRRTKAGDLGGARVLCLDNEPAILEGMRVLLEGWSCQVLTAADLPAAEAALNGTRPDAILADFHLDEGESGLEALDRLQARYPEPVPAVLVTADRSEELRNAAASRDYAVLYKPVKPAALRALLTRILVRG
ncbi:MAG TPA: PAS domain-containing hybrid sensor histidine kinase/response regulator [Alphaproteobacteria bacterium]|nr:PAS domain-containing hybrid sensor histidine kinase/response regulator [Alphaproteobacteria bacterium]